MRIPNRIQDVIDRKNKLLDELRLTMDNDVIKLQSVLFESIISKIVPEIELDLQGNIRDTANNYRLLSELDKTFRDFEGITYDKLIPALNTGFQSIQELSNNYFHIGLGQELPALFERVALRVKKLTEVRFGIVGDKMVRGGIIADMIKNAMNVSDIKKNMLRAITSNMNISDFTNNLKTDLLGKGKETGRLERQFNRYAYDVYQQYDASYNAKLAEEIKLQYFIYQGGLVKDSRDFCHEHNNHVYSTKEAKEWDKWTPAKAIYITEFKQKDLYSVPGYMDYEGYDPLVDRGGYNCRHSLAFISDNLAFKLRPELKEKINK